MIKTKVFARNILLAGALPLLLASSALAQDRESPRATDQDADRGYANRTVEGTVASVVPDRWGNRIRLTNGMDLFVPNSVVITTQGRRYQTALQPGDVVRMSVNNRDSDRRDGDRREGDVRDVRVSSLELLRPSHEGYNDRRLDGIVVSFDRRNSVLVLQTDSGRMINVDVRSYDGRFRRGDRVSVSGRMDRDRGNFIAERVRVGDRDHRE
jgi:ribosomal protein L14